MRVRTGKTVQINIDRSPLAAVTRCRGRQAGSNPPSPFASARRADHARIRTFSANPDSQQCISNKRCCVRGRRGRISRRAWRSWRRASPPAPAVQTRACTQAGNANARQRPPAGLHGLAYKKIETWESEHRQLQWLWVDSRHSMHRRTNALPVLDWPPWKLLLKPAALPKQPNQLAIKMDGHASPCLPAAAARDASLEVALRPGRGHGVREWIPARAQFRLVPINMSHRDQRLLASARMMACCAARSSVFLPHSLG